MLPSPSKKTIIINMGWHTMVGELLAHLWHSRAGIEMAVSSCGRTCVMPLDFESGNVVKCPACQAAEELRLLGSHPTA
jgi:hypothetical protein